MRVPTDDAEAPRVVARDSAWRTLFDTQCMDDGMAKTRLWTGRRVQWLATRGVDLEGEDAESLIQAALCAVLAGDEPWDPMRFTLGRYVFQIVRARTSKMATRGRLAAVPLDELDDQVVSDALERSWTEGVAAPDDRVDAARVSAGVHALVFALRKLAVGDRDVQRVMNAMADGATSAADIVHTTGLSRDRYAAARRRLDRMVKRVPRAVRAEAGYPPASGAPELPPHAGLEMCQGPAGRTARLTADRQRRTTRSLQAGTRASAPPAADGPRHRS